MRAQEQSGESNPNHLFSYTYFYRLYSEYHVMSSFEEFARHLKVNFSGVKLPDRLKNTDVMSCLMFLVSLGDTWNNLQRLYARAKSALFSVVSLNVNGLSPGYRKTNIKDMHVDYHGSWDKLVENTTMKSLDLEISFSDAARINTSLRKRLPISSLLSLGNDSDITGIDMPSVACGDNFPVFSGDSTLDNFRIITEEEDFLCSLGNCLEEAITICEKKMNYLPTEYSLRIKQLLLHNARSYKTRIDDLVKSTNIKIRDISHALFQQMSGSKPGDVFSDGKLTIRYENVYLEKQGVSSCAELSAFMPYDSLDLFRSFMRECDVNCEPEDTLTFTVEGPMKKKDGTWGIKTGSIKFSFPGESSHDVFSPLPCAEIPFSPESLTRDYLRGFCGELFLLKETNSLSYLHLLRAKKYVCDLELFRATIEGETIFLFTALLKRKVQLKELGKKIAAVLLHAQHGLSIGSIYTDQGKDYSIEGTELAVDDSDDEIFPKLMIRLRNILKSGSPGAKFSVAFLNIDTSKLSDGDGCDWKYYDLPELAHHSPTRKIPLADQYRTYTYAESVNYSVTRPLYDIVNSCSSPLVKNNGSSEFAGKLSVVCNGLIKNLYPDEDKPSRSSLVLSAMLVKQQGVKLYDIIDLEPESPGRTVMDIQDISLDLQRNMFYLNGPVQRKNRKPTKRYGTAFYPYNWSFFEIIREPVDVIEEESTVLSGEASRIEMSVIKNTIL